MKKCENYELERIKGGVSETAVFIITSLVIFLFGALSGYTNPKVCNK